MARDEELESASRFFREAVINSDRSNWELNFKLFPNGCCRDASELLARYLKENFDVKNIEIALGESGSYADGNEKSHAWVVCDGLTIDITADQFGQPSVIVMRRSSWHEQTWERIQSGPPCVSPSQWPHYPMEAWRSITAYLAAK
ncbi:MAG: hypothetical protein HYU59_02315 [Magnetospirillum gryphiswaldense]|nr:hypothetical protein [Magnetospirillum gryphiswaldense]